MPSSSYRFKENIVLHITGSLFTLTLFMSPLAASAEALTPLLLEFGQPRSLLWGIVEDRPQGSARYAFQLADQLALNPERKNFPYTIGTSLTFTPLLKYDRNVNNGFKGDTIYIWGLPFSVDESTRAVESATLGGAVSGGVSFGLTKGMTLTTSGRSEYQRAIGAEFEVFNNTAAVNVGYTSQSWDYLNAGFLYNQERRSLSNDTIQVASFTAGKLFGDAGRQLHDFSGTFSRVHEKSAWQNRVRVDWTGTFADYGVFKGGLELGEKINGTLLPQTSISASYSNVIFGAATTISAYYSERTGGFFFGTARQDNIFKIKADRKLSERVSVYLSYERKDSSIDSFDEAGLDVGFNITGFSFR